MPEKVPEKRERDAGPSNSPSAEPKGKRLKKTGDLGELPAESAEIKAEMPAAESTTAAATASAAAAATTAAADAGGDEVSVHVAVRSSDERPRGSVQL